MSPLPRLVRDSLRITITRRGQAELMCNTMNNWAVRVNSRWRYNSSGVQCVCVTYQTVGSDGQSLTQTHAPPTPQYTISIIIAWSINIMQKYGHKCWTLEIVTTWHRGAEPTERPSTHVCYLPLPDHVCLGLSVPYNQHYVYTACLPPAPLERHLWVDTYTTIINRQWYRLVPCRDYVNGSVVKTVYKISSFCICCHIE